MSDDKDLVCDLVVDYVVELLGRRYRKSQIKIELARKINGGKALDIYAFNLILKTAKQKIRNLYGIDPLEAKGRAIEFLELIIRDDKASLNYKLKAHEDLVDLLGLNTIGTEDPTVYAAKVAEALREMDNTILGEDLNAEPDAPVQEKTTSQTNDSIDDSTNNYEENNLEDEKLKEALKIVQLTEDGLQLKEAL